MTNITSGLVRTLLGLTIALVTPAALQAQDVMRLGHNRTWSNTALILGIANGDFSRFGVTVVEHEFTTPADIITAIASGDLDVGTAPGGNLFTAVGRGVKAKAVAVAQGRNNPPIAFTVRSDSGINTVADLRGKTIAVNNYGGTHDIYLRYWLEHGGLDPKKDVNIITVPVPAMVPSLLKGQIDMAPMASFDQVILSHRYSGQTKTLFSYDDVVISALGNSDNNGLLLAMSDDLIAKRRDVATRFMQGYVQAVRATNADPKKAVQQWAAVVGNDMLKNLDGPPAVPDDGRIYTKALQFDADLTHRFGYLKAPIDVQSLIDNRLVDAAQPR
jgi:NitT/TauT family transport system substrate-binding protein